MANSGTSSRAVSNRQQTNKGSQSTYVQSGKKGSGSVPSSGPTKQNGKLGKSF